MPDRWRQAIASELAGKFGQDVLLSVPGFFVNKHGCFSIACMTGLLIPVRDARGRIIALRVRLDRDPAADKPPDKAKKYVWLSSSKHDGPGSGAPVHIPLGTPERAELVSPSSDWQPVETSAPQTTQSATPEETKPGEGPKGDPQDTATRAAAWENWKHIRDTVMGSTADLGDVAAAALSNTSQDEPSTKPEAMAAAASAGSAASTGSASSLSEGDAIANIVDSVLAELKPKLMEEIAKKMKKGSK